MEDRLECGGVVLEGPKPALDHRVPNAHVLLRHRLLHQPRGFEGCLIVVELLVANDLARADGEDQIVAGAHARPAHPSTPALAADYQHIVAAVDEALSLAPPLIPLLKPALKGLLHALMPVIDPAVRALRVLDPFDIRVAGLRDE